MIMDYGIQTALRRQRTRFYGIGAFCALVMIVLLAGCAEKGPILLNIGYQPAGGKTAEAKKIIAGVSPFRDGRGTAASVLGTRTVPSGMKNELVVQGTVADLVTEALSNALEARGLKVKTIPAWDLSAEDMKAEGAGVLLGGEIKTLRLNTTATVLKTNLTASVQLKIVVGDTAEKKIIRTLDVHSTIEQEILYSRDKLESALSEALTSALDQVFQDDVVSKRLRLQ
jgi:uncharacterized lipoprotein YajG